MAVARQKVVLDGGEEMLYNNDNAAIIRRESDGLQFERCYHPGMVRCEACLQLVEPNKVREHKCVDWWNVDLDKYFRDWQ